MLDEGVKTVSQWSRSITPPSMTSPCARATEMLASIWTWARSEGLHLQQQHGVLSWKQGQTLLHMPVVALLGVQNQFYTTLIVPKHISCHHCVKEPPMRKGPDLRRILSQIWGACLQQEYWVVELDATPIILIQARVSLAEGMKSASKYPHSILTSHIMPSLC